MDGACALQVMNDGIGGDLNEKYIREIVSIETKIHPDALQEKVPGGGH